MQHPLFCLIQEYHKSVCLSCFLPEKTRRDGTFLRDAARCSFVLQAVRSGLLFLNAVSAAAAGDLSAGRMAKGERDVDFPRKIR